MMLHGDPYGALGGPAHRAFAGLPASARPQMSLPTSTAALQARPDRAPQHAPRPRRATWSMNLARPGSGRRKPEDGDLRAQPGHVVEAAPGVGDRPRVRRVIEDTPETHAPSPSKSSGAQWVRRR